MQTQEFAKNYAKFYESLNSKSAMHDYGVFFDKNSQFEDPFQKVQGLEDIYTIFESMYEKLHNPRFIVKEIISSQDVAYLQWTLEYSLTKKSKHESFVGVTRVTFNKDGKVDSHIDYWDAAKHVYEKIPILGSLIRFVKRKIHI